MLRYRWGQGSRDLDSVPDDELYAFFKTDCERVKTNVADFFARVRRELRAPSTSSDEFMASITDRLFKLEAALAATTISDPKACASTDTAAGRPCSLTRDTCKWRAAGHHTDVTRTKRAAEVKFCNKYLARQGRNCRNLAGPESARCYRHPETAQPGQ
ncbi:hypothetical protein SPRG_17129 [Saprolegnia parasitica CBS 223.65]|uniref:Uncharacterized protein n=1 Tax=Saprolegnia parasitica (strain CBS 223.65) TaxID=695850 RepID=A0A067BGC0_SAPPC|nr:hypothetical protein SPRG_17129 [Saprolegnia parasitica CBS 223.65]KDO17454.1 hypothetical protein SPRG_17129 [Saprolegnia parasitica CBS 223.65]|eukprot:XP_012211837.1 hypothetical protein SPRG_17129 [Saprolegnia parasitica CBS 223.65]